MKTFEMRESFRQIKGCTYVTGQVVLIWTTQDDTNDDGIFRLSTWLF